MDVTTSYQINEYAVPSDALHTGTINCQIGPGFTSFKDVKDIWEPSWSMYVCLEILKQNA